MEVVIGVDAHKQTHTFVAADELGRQVASTTLPATSDGHLAALRWAADWPQRRWAIEDCRHLTRRLERDLIAAGQRVVRVHTQLMAGARQASRQRGKSDPIDALAVARAAWREPDLPVAQLDGPTRELRLLVDYRDDLVAERTRLQNRLRWHLHELDPELQPAAPVPGAAPDILERLARRLAVLPQSARVRICRELIGRIRELHRRAAELKRHLHQLVKRHCPACLSSVAAAP